MCFLHVHIVHVEVVCSLFNCTTILCDMGKCVPYSGKVWWVESLANLVNCLQFAKLKPSKVVVTINNPLADLFIH